LFYQKRVRKKKSLTDFVEIINFPGQEDKNTPKQTTAKQENATSSYATLSFKKEAKTLATPTGNLQSTMISIKEITQKKDQNEGDSYESHENKPQNNFTLDDLKIHWRKFAYKMKEDGNDTIYLAMKKRDPKVTADYQVIHEVDNQVQIDYIQTHLGELVDYLRESLRNWSIKVSFSITESEEENIQLQTGKDKFNALARKNPNLYTLQKTFNLDIEY
jgi:hypothetical protein